MDTPLYNLSPAAVVLLLGALTAAGPLLWVSLRKRQFGLTVRYHALAVTTLVIAFELVLLGAFTRLSDSGLGCPDWPGCYGSASPVGAHAQIATAQAAMPTGPVTHSKAWIEMLHRYFATGMGALTIILALMAALIYRRSRTRADKVQLLIALATFLWTCAQGAFGALTVTMKLFPAIVTLHLLGAYGLLALLVLQVWHSKVSTAGQSGTAAGVQTPIAQMSKASADTLPLPTSLPRLSTGLVGLLMGAALLLLVQATSGAWVSSNYAVLACSEFPLCQGQWLPAMDFAAGFEWWHPLGERASGEMLSLQALTAIHITHRTLAWLTAAVLLLLAWRSYRIPDLQKSAKVLLLLLVAQLLTGLSNVLLGWPLLGAMLHTAGAGAMLVLLVWMLAVGLHRWRQPTPEQPSAPLRKSTMTASNPSAAGDSVLRQFYALTKPRVIQLIVFCALIGMVLAVPGVPSWAQVLHAAIACVGIYLVAAAAAAFNCIVEKGIDAKMKRTAWRPTARGQLQDGQTLLFSAILCVAGSVLLYCWVNPLTMWLTFATFVGYALVYTVVLKPRTPQNIVIGGASGAMPPVLGWAAMTGEVGAYAAILFLIIFLWTPPHFWALALYRVEDYRKSGLPMLPVTHGSDYTRLHIFLYTWILFAACLLPFIEGMSSWLYLAVALVLSAGFCWYGWCLWRNYSDALARKTFRFSLIHLSVLFAALLLDHYLLPPV